MTFNKKILTALVVGSLSISSVSVMALSQKEENNNVMSVNNKEIKEKELYNKIMFSSDYKATLEVLDGKVLEKKYKDDKRLNSMIEAKYKEIADSLKKDDPNMEKEFASYGVDNKASYIKKAGVRLGALRELAAIDTAAQKLFKQEEIDYIYDNKFSGTAKISSILIEPKMSAKDTGNNGLTDKAKAEANKEAEKVISEIKGGLSFKDAYNKYSADKTLENGYIGTFNVEQAHTAQLENPVIKEAFSLKDKTSSTTPVETSRGYEIISVEYTVPKKSFEDVKNDVNKMLFDLYQGNNNFTREYVLDQFRADEKIEITDEVQSKQHANSVLQNRKSYTTFDPEAQNNGLNYGY